VRDGLATAHREKARVGREIITVTRLRITGAGRRALAACSAAGRGTAVPTVV